MINRREFFRTLGASAALSTMPVCAASPYAMEPSSRRRVQLNGTWEVHLNGELYDAIDVPSSRQPMGFYKLRRNFVLPQLRGGERAFIHFDAIAYCGRLSINGHQLGVMGPYVPLEFEFTRYAKEENNEIELEMADLVPWPDGTGRDELALGVNPGWEAYGGIIRDVWAEVRPASFIENVRFAYRLSDDYSVAHCRPSVLLSSREASNGTVQVEIQHGSVEVARSSASVHLRTGANEIEIPLEVKTPALWSPNEPNLYELIARVKTDAAEDTWACLTGFRHLTTQGREFRLNGSKLVLHGVCRHDMWKGQGFTLSRQQQEQDMRMIKMLGCNFVRLVHYPHDRRIIDLADELGLLVSEEPGYWNVDFRTMPRSEIELGYRIMEAMIRRDWNSPAVMAWLLSNECWLTTEFLKEGKVRCNRLDPIGRLVSAANSKPSKLTKTLFDAAGMDFFDQHPYTFDVEQFKEEVEIYGPGKPLIFSEWGGKAIGQTATVMSQSVDRLLDLTESGDLAGHAFWSWQDMRQYTRIDDEMRDGILESGVVTEARDPREVVYLELARLFEERRQESQSSHLRPEVIPLRWSPWSNKSTFETVNLQPLAEIQEAQRAWTSFKDHMARYWKGIGEDQWKRTGEDFLLWQGGGLEISGVNFQMPVVNRYIRPLVLTPEFPEVVIPVNRKCRRLHILGQVTFTEGFPVAGSDGESIATYTLEYSSGSTQQIPLRNGYEVAQSNIINETTRLDARATEAQRALVFVKDIAREQYQILLLSIPTEGGTLTRIRCSLSGEQPPLGIFAVTTELS